MRLSDRAEFAGLAACFTLSGFAALVYQTAWTRQFAFVFGTSELAIAVVLAAYMAGLCVGAIAGGWLAARIQRPVLAYGLLELGIALSALAVPLGIAASRAAMLALFGGRAELPGADEMLPSLFGLAASALIMMIPTAFMGATLPLLAKHAVRREGEIGPRVGALYALNTAGAVGGTLATAFALLPTLGLQATIWIAVSINALVFVLAAAVARGGSDLRRPEAATAGAAKLSGRWVLVLLAVSGWVSFSYEVLWTRLLSHLLGGSIYAFAVMLASFLLGIALGASLSGRLCRDATRAAWVFAAAQLGACVLAIASFHFLAWVPEWATPLLDRSTGIGLPALIALTALLPSALCFGIAFPAGVRILARRPEDAGAASARAFAANTAGAIVGALSCAYFTLPALAFAGTLTLLAATSALLAAVAIVAAHGVRAVAAAPIAAALLIAAFPPGEPWKLLMSSPLPGGGESFASIRHYAVGRSATVVLSDAGPGRWRLRSNGLPEALIIETPSLRRAGASTRWLGGLAPLLRPDTASIASVGLGGGVHLEAIPGEVKTIDAIELEQAVVDANRAIGSRRSSDPLADPRLRVIVNDARSALLLSERRFDAIVAQASHPWTAGSSHLYTREFFELIDSRLTDAGVFVQWMGAPFTNEELLSSLVATLTATWPHVQVYRPLGGDLLFAASRQPFTDPAETIHRELRKRPRVMAALGIASPLDVELALLLDEEAARAFADGAPINTDDRNLLQMRSPELLHSNTSLAHAAPHPRLDRFDTIAQPRDDVDQLYLVRRLIELGNFERAALAAAAVQGESAREAAAAMVASFRSGPGALAAILEVGDTRSEARGMLLQRLRTHFLARRADVDDLPWRADARERAVAEGWRALGDGDWETLRASEAVLASIGFEHPLANDAHWLRAVWRCEIGHAYDVVKAGDLLDTLIARGADRVEWYLTRARVHERASETTAALGALTEMLIASGGTTIPRAWREQAVALLQTLELQPEWQPWRDQLVRALGGPRDATG